MTPLLAHPRRGDRAFARLYRRNVGDVYRYALVVLRDPEDAEDVTQTTFLNAYRAFGHGGRPANARAWLLALAHDVCRQRVRAPTVAQDEDEAVRAVPDATRPTPAEIRRALAQLPFNQRAALVMRELEGRSYAEIAHVLEEPPSAVETLVFEARHALREQLEGALSCHQAERAISLQVDGRLPRSERRPLRAHLRECQECDGFARSQRAQRSAWKTLAAVPLPATLQSFFGPGGVLTRVGSAAGGVAVGTVVKALAIGAVGAIGAVAVGLGYESHGPEALSPGGHVAREQAAPSGGRPASPAGRPTPAERPSGRSTPAAKAPASAAPRPVSAAPSATPVLVAQASTQARATKQAQAQPQALAVRARSQPKSAGLTQTAASSPKHQPEPAARAEEAPAGGADPPPPPPPPPPSPPPPPLLPLELPQFPPAPPLPLPEPPKLP